MSIYVKSPPIVFDMIIVVIVIGRQVVIMMVIIKCEYILMYCFVAISSSFEGHEKCLSACDLSRVKVVRAYKLDDKTLFLLDAAT